MKEVRTIIFTNEEVQLALTEHCKRRGKPLPAGVVKRFTFKSEPMSASLVLANDRGAEASFDFSQIEVAASLIGYCLHRKVPLPAKAEKQIQIIANSFVLVVTMLGKKAEETPTSDQRRAAVTAAVSAARR